MLGCSSPKKRANPYYSDTKLILPDTTSNDLKVEVYNQDRTVIDHGVITDPGHAQDTINIQDVPQDKDKHVTMDTGNYLDTATKDISTEDQGVCIPDCKGRQCGPDGCGGSCGSCPENSECIQGQCQCTPDCINRVCGPDGCGGQCKPGCPQGVMCTPDGKCADKTGPCKPKGGHFNCNPENPIVGNTGLNVLNSDVLDIYTCNNKQSVASGPEVVYKFTPSQDGQAIITLHTKHSDYIRLFLLNGSQCSSKNCIQQGVNNKLQFSIKKGSSYYIVIDAVKNRTASYTLDVVCQ